MYIQIETPRLSLRPISLNDDRFILTLLNTEGWLKNIGDRNVRTSIDARAYIQRILDTPNFYYTVIEKKESPEPIGVVSFIYRDAHEHPDIGFALLPEYEKKGYAYEAANAYLNHLLKTPDTKKILGITLPSNNPSINLLERLGFRFEKTLLKDNEELSIFSLYPAIS